MGKVEHNYNQEYPRCALCERTKAVTQKYQNRYGETLLVWECVHCKKDVPLIISENMPINFIIKRIEL